MGYLFSNLDFICSSIGWDWVISGIFVFMRSLWLCHASCLADF